MFEIIWKLPYRLVQLVSPLKKLVNVTSCYLKMNIEVMLPISLEIEIPNRKIQL